jgi:hypothetical protein
MNVWPETRPPECPSLVGSEGELVSISLAVEPRRLERLLESLAGLPFPLNPQIYHDAQVARLYPDGRRETERATIVAFPAYRSRLEQIREALASAGFDPASAWASKMLERIHSDYEAGPPPPGAPYAQIFRGRYY